MTVVPNGKSHGLVIIVDWSGSMQGHLMNTVKQLFHIVMFCKKINVPYEVYSFTDSYSYDATKPRQVYRKGDVRIDGNFLLQNILSHRMNPAQFIEAASAITLVAKGKNNLEIPKTFYMGGTPLNSVIVTAMDMVTDFKHTNRLEIVNTVFLTDGDSQRFENYVDPSYTTVRIPFMSYIKGVYRSYSIVMTDPVTKYQVEYDTSSAKKETSALMELMRMRTNCNVIGFYILSLYEIGGQLQYFSKSKEESEKLRENFIKDNHCVLTNAGYNEYYLIRSEKYVDSNDTFSTSASTTRGLVNAFTKFAGKKVNNRVVLNRFINLITGQMEQHI
jgi:hypothetical protein